MRMDKDWLLDLDTLRSRRNSKWTRYAPDVIPAWLAEMDFAPAPAIREAIGRLTRDEDYGYPRRNGDRAEFAVARAFSERMLMRFGWEVDPTLVLPLADLVQGTFGCVIANSEPGDEVILQIPAYPPFREAITTTGRRLVSHQVRYDGSRIDMNVEHLHELVSDRTRIILLCNPQNPSGHVYTLAELETVARLAVERDLVVVADEIHSDLVYPGRTHIPIASLGPEIASRTVTLNSATKSFNIAGMRCGAIHFGSESLRRRFDSRIPARLLGVPSSFGVDATVAAWREGQPWLDEVLVHLREVRDRFAAVLEAQLPQLRFHAPEATYLGWIDCRGLKLDEPAFDFFHREARIAFSAGETFDPGCADFVRINFATSHQIADEIVGRMARAIGERTRTNPHSSQP